MHRKIQKIMQNNRLPLQYYPYKTKSDGDLMLMMSTTQIWPKYKQKKLQVKLSDLQFMTLITIGREPEKQEAK